MPAPIGLSCIQSAGTLNLTRVLANRQFGTDPPTFTVPVSPALAGPETRRAAALPVGMRG